MRMYNFVCFSTILLASVWVARSQDIDSAQPEPTSATPLAEMRGYQLTEDDWDLLLELLPSVDREKLTPEQRHKLISNWMQIVAFSEEAQAQGLDKEPAVQKRLEMFRRRILYEVYQQRLLRGIEVSEEEAKQFYEEHKDKFQSPGQARVSRILLPTREKADEVSKALAEGVPFEKLASEESTDGISRRAGGDIGWIKPGHKEPEVLRMALALEPNQVSEPFATPLGWQVIKVTEKRPAVQKSFSDVRETIIRQVKARKQLEVVASAADELCKKYEVKIHYDPK